MACESAGMPVHEFLQLPHHVQVFHLEAAVTAFEQRQEMHNKRFKALQDSIKQMLKAF